MKFKYLVSSNSLDTRGHHTKRPLIKLEQITLDGKIFYSYGLIDSGADQTMVNIQYANVLGIDLSKSPERKMNGIAEGAVITKATYFDFIAKLFSFEITVPACF